MGLYNLPQVQLRQNDITVLKTNSLRKFFKISITYRVGKRVVVVCLAVVQHAMATYTVIRPYAMSQNVYPRNAMMLTLAARGTAIAFRPFCLAYPIVQLEHFRNKLVAGKRTTKMNT